MPLDLADGDSPSGAGVLRFVAAAKSMRPLPDREVPESQGSSWAGTCFFPAPTQLYQGRPRHQRCI